MSFYQILKARYFGNIEQLHETSLNRLRTHFMRHMKNSHEGNEPKSFGYITAWRKTRFNKNKEPYDAAKTLTINKLAMKQLEDEISSMGYGYTKVRGHWRECIDSNIPYNQCTDEQKVDSQEPTLVVFGISLDEINRIGVQFEQDAWVYAGPETNGKVKLIGKDGKNTRGLPNFSEWIDNWEEFVPNVTDERGMEQQGYTRLKNYPGAKTFAFDTKDNVEDWKKRKLGMRNLSMAAESKVYIECLPTSPIEKIMETYYRNHLDELEDK